MPIVRRWSAVASSALVAGALLMGAGGTMGATPAPIGKWQLKGTLNNSASGPATLAELNDPGFETVTDKNGAEREGLVFSATEGLELGGIPTKARRSYTIVLDVRFDDVDGYQRILSFGPNDSDRGLYVFNGGTRLYPPRPVVDDPPFAAGDWLTIRVTRDRVTQKMQIVTQGSWGGTVIRFRDLNDRFLLRSGIVDFFQDDSGEHSEGAVTRIVLWDKALPLRFGHD